MSAMPALLLASIVANNPKSGIMAFHGIQGSVEMDIAMIQVLLKGGLSVIWAPLEHSHTFCTPASFFFFSGRAIPGLDPSNQGTAESRRH
jgi:hypothetical protein